MFSQEIALTLLANLPLTTQLSMLETAFKVALFTGKISLTLFRKLRGSDNSPSPTVIIEVKDNEDDEYVLLSKY